MRRVVLKNTGFVAGQGLVEVQVDVVGALALELALGVAHQRAGGRQRVRLELRARRGRQRGQQRRGSAGSFRLKAMS